MNSLKKLTVAVSSVQNIVTNDRIAFWWWMTKKSSETMESKVRHETAIEYDGSDGFKSSSGFVV